jgi:hypothetical protein
VVNISDGIVFQRRFYRFGWAGSAYFLLLLLLLLPLLPPRADC